MIQKKKFSEAISANISVVEELMGINPTWLKWKGIVGTGLDVNAIIEPGIYQILSSHTGNNKPPIFGLLEVYGDEKGSYITVQRVTSFTTNTSIQRVKSSTNTWTEWG